MNENVIFIEIGNQGTRIAVPVHEFMRLAADYLLRRGSEGSYNLELDRETWATVACVARPAGEGICGDNGLVALGDEAPLVGAVCQLPAGHGGFLRNHVDGALEWPVADTTTRLSPDEAP